MGEATLQIRDKCKPRSRKDLYIETTKDSCSECMFNKYIVIYSISLFD